MDYGEFIATVQQLLGDGTQTAERATRATLQTLAERIGADESLQLASQLPPEVGPWLTTAGGAKAFDAEEFVHRVADRLRVDTLTAQRHAEAVLVALGRAVSDSEYAHLVSRLSKDYAPLLPKGSYARIMSAEEFLAGVANRAGLDAARARLITEAVLETLAERIAAGEVDHLMSQLPIQLHAALKRGKAHADKTSQRMRVDEFVRRVAQRASLGPEQARDQAGAVFATLREAIGDKELLDVTVQLPSEYRVLLAHAP
jgi:uncharacterized protein (DUF2267 family)